HLHEHVLETMAIAETDEVQKLVSTRDSKATCTWLSQLLSGKDSPVNPEDAYDVLGVTLPGGELLGMVIRGKAPCIRKSKTPLPTVKGNQGSEITNWESEDQKFFEIITSPVRDADERIAGMMIAGFDVAGGFARHIKEHTGQDNLVWHEEGNEAHLLGASDPAMASLLSLAVENWRSGQEPTSGQYAILDAGLTDRQDKVSNPL